MNKEDEMRLETLYAPSRTKTVVNLISRLTLKRPRWAPKVFIQVNIITHASIVIAADLPAAPTDAGQPAD